MKVNFGFFAKQREFLSILEMRNVAAFIRNNLRCTKIATKEP